MFTVAVDQTELPLVEGKLIAEDLLAVFSVYDIKKFQIFMGVHLGADARLKSFFVGKGDTGGDDCGRNSVWLMDIPDQAKHVL